jgi:hypothetical protein
MKLINKKTLALAALSLSMGSSIFAYTWEFTNRTTKPLVLRLSLKLASGWSYQIVNPNQKVSFTWGGGTAFWQHALWGIEWASYDPNIKLAGVTQNGGLDLYRTGAKGNQDDVDWREFNKIPYQYKTLVTICPQAACTTTMGARYDIVEQANKEIVANILWTNFNNK